MLTLRYLNIISSNTEASRSFFGAKTTLNTHIIWSFGLEIDDICYYYIICNLIRKLIRINQVRL